MNDINKMPKILAESVNLLTPKPSSNSNLFILNISSGEANSCFVFTPEHIKALAKMIIHNIKKYEMEFGTIKEIWKPSIESPFMPIKNEGNNNKDI